MTELTPTQLTRVNGGSFDWQSFLPLLQNFLGSFQQVIDSFGTPAQPAPQAPAAATTKAAAPAAPAAAAPQPSAGAGPQAGGAAAAHGGKSLLACLGLKV